MVGRGGWQATEVNREDTLIKPLGFDTPGELCTRNKLLGDTCNKLAGVATLEPTSGTGWVGGLTVSLKCHM